MRLLKIRTRSTGHFHAHHVLILFPLEASKCIKYLRTRTSRVMMEWAHTLSDCRAPIDFINRFAHNSISKKVKTKSNPILFLKIQTMFSSKILFAFLLLAASVQADLRGASSSVLDVSKRFSFFLAVQRLTITTLHVLSISYCPCLLPLFLRNVMLLICVYYNWKRIC